MKKFFKILGLLILISIIVLAILLVGQELHSYSGQTIDITEFLPQQEEEIDYEKLINTIQTNTIKANVTVYNKSYNKTLILGIETESRTTSGSGVIIGLNKNGYYFALTNCHVTVLASGYKFQSFTVEDYKGNTYVAVKYHQSSEYDLAVIYFEKSIELKVLQLETKNPNIGDKVVSLGQPKGQKNTTTFGTITSYKQITVTGGKSLNFKSITHDAPTNSGSSGGAILNTDIKIVGINYAGSHDEKADYSSMACAIPVEKVNEYLNKYYYKK